MKFHKLLTHCIGGITVANVIIWINIILLVGKNRVERFIVEQPGYFGTVRGKLDQVFARSGKGTDDTESSDVASRD